MDSDLKLIIVVDGLRPDAINHTDMPRLAGLRDHGTTFTNTHAAIPSVTRVNGAALATGAYPSANGIVGNHVYMPVVDPSMILNMAKVPTLDRIRAETGQLVQVPTLAEYLASADRRFVLVSSGSGGTARAANPNVGHGGGITISCDDPDTPGALVYGDHEPSDPAAKRDATRIAAEIRTQFGEPPAKRGTPEKTASVGYANRVLLDYAIPTLQPHVAMLWMTEPDGVQHRHQPGSPQAVEVLRTVDQYLGEILDRVTSEFGDRAHIVVVSDHGFTTSDRTGPDVADELCIAGLKARPDSTDVVVANNSCISISIADRDPARIRDVTAFLQSQSWTGTLFTAAANADANDLAGRAHGHVPGTLSLELVRVANERGGPDILMGPAWSDRPNAFGTAGFSLQSPDSKAGQHGSISPWDLRSTMIVTGPGIPKGVTSPAPVGNVDVTPTILDWCGIQQPSTVDGRVLTKTDMDPKVEPTTQTVVATSTDGSYRCAVQISQPNGNHRADLTHYYVDGAWRLTA